MWLDAVVVAVMVVDGGCVGGGYSLSDIHGH